MDVADWAQILKTARGSHACGLAHVSGWNESLGSLVQREILRPLKTDVATEDCVSNYLQKLKGFCAK